MQYILENHYTKKLYEQIGGSVTGLKLLSMADVATLDPGHSIIVDEGDQETFDTFHYFPTELIVLTEKNAPYVKSDSTIRYVKKYQSTKNILTLISQSAFPITFLIFATKEKETINLIERIVKKHDIDTVISLDFSPNSKFSLFDSLLQFDHKVVNQAHLDVITNIEDYLNPPTYDIVQFLNHLKERKRLLIVSAPLKGGLDAALINLADAIILVDNDPTQRLEPHLSHRLHSKRFEVITYD